MPLHIIAEANRCYNCKNPQCQQGCPVHTPIPQIIQLFKENRLMEAGKILFENNPLSAVCALICDHEKQCAGHCIRGRKDTPVHFSSIEHYISDMYLDRMDVPPRTWVQLHKVAVIGAGPAGITAAIELARRGYRVTIFEWHSKIGGILQYGIPEFRLSKGYLERYRERLEAMDIQLRLNTTVGSVIMIDDLMRDGYSAVFIGTGAEKPRRLGVPGESLGNVYFSLNYLANPRGIRLGETVAVIGAGNAAMDVARTALRYGSRRVTMYAKADRVAASANEVSYAQLDGAELETGMQIQAINESGPVFKRAIRDESGAIVGYDDKLIQVRADATVIAVSQVPRHKLVHTTDGLELTENGLLAVDDNYMTTRPGVFGAGDVITGAKTVVHAVEGAKRAAAAIARYLSAL